jgi:hypothetical protein
MSKKKLFMFAPVAIAGLALLIFAGGEIVMHLWNWLTPQLWGWREITFWQAIGLLALARILVGGFGGGHRGPGPRRRLNDRMTDRMAERWEHMNPEERERFREGLRRCGIIPPSEATQL